MPRWMLTTVALLGLPALAGCASGAKEKPATQPDESPWEVRVESPLDTVTYATGGGEWTAADTAAAPGAVLEMPAVTEERAPATGEAPAGGGVVGAGAAGAAGAAGTTAPAKLPAPEDFTPGWRVQLLASTFMDKADQLAVRARQRFTEPVYVEFHPPLYKVRVGDFLTKAEAQSMATRAKAEGFEAWVVEALVVKPRP